MTSQWRQRWRVAAERPLRVALVDAASDQGAWDEQVELVRRLYQGELLDRVGVLGWAGTADAEAFLDAPAAWYAEHRGRGRIAGIPLCSLEAEFSGRAARVVALSGQVADECDWLPGSALWPALRLSTPDSADLGGWSRPATACLLDDSSGVGPVLVSVPAGAAIALCDPELGGQADPGRLSWTPADRDTKLHFDICWGERAGAAAPVLRGAVGWRAEPVDAGPEQVGWRGPVDLGERSVAAVVAYSRGRPYECPRDGARHARTLHCPAGRFDLLPTAARWALPELDGLNRGESGLEPWVVLVLAGRRRESDPASATLWSLPARVLFEAESLVLTRRRRSGDVSAWRVTPAGWSPAGGPTPAGGDELVFRWRPAGEWPWHQRAERRADAYLLGV